MKSFSRYVFKLANLAFLFSIGFLTAGVSAQEPYIIHVMSMSSQHAAERQLSKIRSRHPDLLRYLDNYTQSVTADNGQTMYRVSYGPFENRYQAEDVCYQLQDRGVNYCRVMRKGHAIRLPR